VSCYRGPGSCVIVPSGLLVVRYIGHGTVLIELDGVRLLTDPLLRARVAHLRRAAPLDDPPGPVDAVLLSHGHYDHLDLPSLRTLGPSARVIAPRGLAPRLAGLDVSAVEEGDELTVGPVTVRATHAEHDGGRPPFGKGPALGYAILGSSRIFFAGDTDLFDAMDGLVPDLDLALIPIWGWGATLGRGKHLDPERAAEAVRRLAPRVAVPIHWGTYRPAHRRATARFLSEPAEAFSRAAAAVAPEVEVRVLRPGESLSL
jgi:L-ascorbate metabolism protein UlaG (beta-lactamase superfamily)